MSWHTVYCSTHEARSTFQKQNGRPQDGHLFCFWHRETRALSRDATMPSQVRTSPATSAGQMLGADRTSAPAARSMLYQSSGLCELGPHQCCASPHVLLSCTLRWALTSSDTWTRGSPSSSTATATSLVPSCPFPTPASEVCELPPARLDPPSSAPGRNAPWLRPIHEPSAGRDGGTGVLFHRSRVI